MKYALLTKEQFDSLFKEFARFLASQNIDKEEWDAIKANKPEVAQQELEVFSDLVWEGVLSRARFLEHFSASHAFLFHCAEDQMESIVIKCLDANVDFLTAEGVEYLKQHMFSDSIEIRVGAKPYSEDRNGDIFQLIQQGAFLSDGEFYTQLKTVLDS